MGYREPWSFVKAGRVEKVNHGERILESCNYMAFLVENGKRALILSLPGNAG